MDKQERDELRRLVGHRSSTMVTGGMDKETHARVHQNGKQVKDGDRETGIWIAPRTDWYEVKGDGNIYILKGSRVKTTWQFRGGRWEVCSMELDNVLPPPKPSRIRWRPKISYVALVVLVLSLAVIGLWPW